MTISHFPNRKGCVIALHCSLGSGRQWARLTEELGPSYQVLAPDISGYGSRLGWTDPPMTLAEEVAHLAEPINRAEGPIHLVGHSYGGAIAFKIATASRFAGRVRGLTLIEPVLPMLLKEGPAVARPVRSTRAQGLRGSPERHAYGGDRPLHVLLERIGTR
jgi:thioesterase domain-containing protein